MEYKIKKLVSGEREYIKGQTHIRVPKDARIKRYPILSHDSNVTDYFGVVPNPSIAVAPNSTVSVFVNMPMDDGIFIKDGDTYSLIDRIEKNDKKFALYGSSSDGMVYRYFETRYTKRRSRHKDGFAPTNIEITNKSKEWKVVSKVIFMSGTFDVFDDKKEIVGEKIMLNISDKGFVTVKLSNIPSVDGAKIMPHSASVTNPKRIKSDVVEMRYGL